jgi:hypothetical protein
MGYHPSGLAALAPQSDELALAPGYVILRCEARERRASKDGVPPAGEG